MITRGEGITLVVAVIVILLGGWGLGLAIDGPYVGAPAREPAEALTPSMQVNVLPDGTEIRDKLRWNEAAGGWEAFSSEDTWFYALTTTNDRTLLPPVLEDEIEHGGNRAIRGPNRTHYNPSVGEVVLMRWNLAYYQMFGSRNSWYWDGGGDPDTTSSAHNPNGTAAAAAAFAHFNVDSLYVWIILPEDTAGEYIQNRFWEVTARGGGTNEAAGTIANTPAFTRVNYDLRISGVSYLVARANVQWEAGTVNRNFGLGFTPQVDLPEVEWVTP